MTPAIAARYAIAALFLLIAADRLTGESLTVTGPADHNDIIMSLAITQPKTYSDDAELEWIVDRNIIGNADKVFLTLKAKVWVQKGSVSPEDEYGLIFARNGTSGSYNHIIHSEVFGVRGSTRDNRRIANVSAWFPVVDGKVKIRVGSLIRGDHTRIEFVAYLDAWSNKRFLTYWLDRLF